VSYRDPMSLLGNLSSTSKRLSTGFWSVHLTGVLTCAEVRYPGRHHPAATGTAPRETEHELVEVASRVRRRWRRDGCPAPDSGQEAYAQDVPEPRGGSARGRAVAPSGSRPRPAITTSARPTRSPQPRAGRARRRAMAGRRRKASPMAPHPGPAARTAATTLVCYVPCAG
jgi:hypothetical protein